MSFKVIVAGSRDFNNYKFLEDMLDFLLKNKTGIEIVSGDADGADKYGETYAIERDYGVKKFPANWKLHGKSAGPIRNIEMGDYAEACVVFRVNKSKGSTHMIQVATEKKLFLRVYDFKTI